MGAGQRGVRSFVFADPKVSLSGSASQRLTASARDPPISSSPCAAKCDGCPGAGEEEPGF